MELPGFANLTETRQEDFPPAWESVRILARMVVDSPGARMDLSALASTQLQPERTSRIWTGDVEELVMDHCASPDQPLPKMPRLILSGFTVRDCP